MPQSVVTVTGLDRPGIIARVTGLLFRAGANLEDISMTILGGQLAMVMIVEGRGPSGESSVKKSFQTLERSGLSMTWRNLESKKKRGAKHLKGSKTYLLTAAGADRTGIVFKISQFFSSKKMNITDLNSKILPGAGKGLYVVVLEVDVPARFSQKAIARGLQSLGRDLKVDIQWRPVESLEL